MHVFINFYLLKANSVLSQSQMHCDKTYIIISMILSLCFVQWHSSEKVIITFQMIKSFSWYRLLMSL